jgi:hypothetical protein
MSSYMLVRHKVRDFSVWKAGYNAHLPKRVEAGLTEAHLFQTDPDLNEVVVLFKAEDLGRARAFAASANLRETMEKLGVIGRPDIYFLND